MKANDSTRKSFLLLGFSDLPGLESLFFFVFLNIYLLILIENVLVISVTLIGQTFHSPMYFFLRNLSWLEICCTSFVMPQMLQNLISVDKTVTFVSCGFQMCGFLITGAAECFLLAVMAYDRYVAICHPLHYMLIMSRKICFVLVAASWLAGIPMQFAQTFLLFSSYFCDSNEINHFFCDYPAVIKLVCGDTSMNEQIAWAEAAFLGIVPLLLIFTSYMFIASAILKMPAVEGRKKAFSTCSSHLIVVILFYGIGIMVYAKPKSNHSQDIDKFLSLSYTVLSPLLNPLIYSLRTREVRGALKSAITVHISLTKRCAQEVE